MIINEDLKIKQKAYKQTLIKLGLLCNQSIITLKKEEKMLKEENKMLSDVKAGQWIWTIQDGWIKVKGIKLELKYPIVTETEESYNLKGNCEIDDFSPSAFLYNPFNPFEKNPCEFKKGEIIAVRNYEKEEWLYFQFSKFNENCYLCINDIHYKYARGLTEEEKGV